MARFQTPRLVACFAILCTFFFLQINSASTADKKEDIDYRVTSEAWIKVVIGDPEVAKAKKQKVEEGIIRIALFGNIVPMTVMNFQHIIKGFAIKRFNKVLWYNNTVASRVVQDFMVQFGDLFPDEDGEEGESIYGKTFYDENFVLSHRSAGWVTMANSGPDSNRSQFIILMVKSRWLDGRHVVFGKMVEGYDFLKVINDVPVLRGYSTPAKSIKIVDCGVKMLDKAYVMPSSLLDSSNDKDFEKRFGN